MDSFALGFEVSVALPFFAKLTPRSAQATLPQARSSRFDGSRQFPLHCRHENIRGIGSGRASVDHTENAPTLPQLDGALLDLVKKSAPACERFRSPPAINPKSSVIAMDKGPGSLRHNNSEIFVETRSEDNALASKSVRANSNYHQTSPTMIPP